MSERESFPLTRRERHRRALAVNAFWGIDGAAHCHDVGPITPAGDFEPKEGEDSYVIILDTETGEFKVEPGDTE